MKSIVSNREDEACNGAATRTIYSPGTEFEECIACRSQVRWDMVDHPFWGFQSCPRRVKPNESLPDPAAAKGAK